MLLLLPLPLLLLLLRWRQLLGGRKGRLGIGGQGGERPALRVLRALLTGTRLMLLQSAVIRIWLAVWLSLAPGRVAVEAGPQRW